MPKHRQRRMVKRLSAHPIRPKGNRGAVSSVSLPLLDNAWALSAAFCLVSATMVRVTRLYPLLGQISKTPQS